MEWIQEPIDINGRAQGPALVLSGTPNQVQIDTEGTYDVWSDADCFIKVLPAANGDATDVTPDTGYPVFSGNVITLFIAQRSKLGAVTSGPAGSLRYHKVG